MILIFYGKELPNNINNLKPNISVEEDVLSVLGQDPVVIEHLNNNKYLIYNFWHEDREVIVIFVLEKDSQGFFLLKEIKKPLINSSKLQNKINEIKKTKYYEDATITMEELKKQPENLLKPKNRIEFLEEFGNDFLTKNDESLIKIFNQNIFNHSQETIKRNIKYYFALKMIINNETQWAAAEKQMINDFEKHYGVIDSPRAAWVLFGVNWLIKQQFSMLQKQFSLKVKSGFFDYFNNNKDRFSYVVSYEIKNKDGVIKKYKNKNTKDLNRNIQEILYDKVELNQWIPLKEKKIKFTKIEKFNEIEHVYEIAVVQGDEDNSSGIQNILKCYQKNNHAIKELKKLAHTEVSTRKICQNSSDPEDQNILQAINYGRGRYYTSSQGRPVALLLINSYDRTKKSISKTTKPPDQHFNIFIKLLINRIFP